MAKTTARQAIEHAADTLIKAERNAEQVGDAATLVAIADQWRRVSETLTFKVGYIADEE